MEILATILIYLILKESLLTKLLLAWVTASDVGYYYTEGHALFGLETLWISPALTTKILFVIADLLGFLPLKKLHFEKNILPLYFISPWLLLTLSLDVTPL